jgi:hypothetical protein
LFLLFDLTQNPQTIVEGLKLLFALVIGHALADYPLQGEYLALHKNRHYVDASNREEPSGLWIHCLLAHSLIHAGFVWLITGRSILALAEFILHAVLDLAKCEHKTGYHMDQALHLSCKVIYVLLIALNLVA